MRVSFFIWLLLDGNINFLTKTKKALKIRTFFVSTNVDDYGGGGGNRTRVRKPIHETFSGCRASFVIPLTAAGAQAAARVAFLCMTASKAKRLFTSATYMMSMPHWGIPRGQPESVALSGGQAALRQLLLLYC